MREIIQTNERKHLVIEKESVGQEIQYRVRGTTKRTRRINRVFNDLMTAEIYVRVKPFRKPL